VAEILTNHTKLDGRRKGVVLLNFFFASAGSGWQSSIACGVKVLSD
jgi:hypothetical protein